MATVYFTSNADSGSGTLRAAINSAKEGDTITYDPTVFTTGPVVISLSSYLPILPKNATLDGGSMGIVLDGQNNSMGGYSSVRGTGTMTVINLTVKRYKVTTNAPVFINAASSTYVFKRCKFVDNTGVWYGVMRVNKGEIKLYDCLLTGNQATGSNSTHGGLSVNTDGTATATVVRTVICGNVYGNLTGSSYLTQSGTFIGLTAPEINGVTPEEIGFVNPPPSAAIPKAGYTEGDWESWDFRLKPTSPYLTGAAYESGDLDLLGHARTGSWGCFDGSWLVVGASGAETVASDASVDWLEIASTGVLTLSGADRILTVNRGVIVESGASIASSSRGYVVAPSASDCSAAALTNVVCCVSGAGASNLAATTAGFTWSATDSTKSVVLELQTNGAWQTVAQSAGTSCAAALTAGASVRLFDGVNFLTATVESGPVEFDLHAWSVYGATIVVSTSSPYSVATQTAASFTVTTGFILMSDYYNRGESPVLFARIQNSETGALITNSDVSSVSYTCYKKTVSWGTETRTPVTGHQTVTIPTSSVLSALVAPLADPRWTVDTTGYNFLFEPDSTTNPIFPDAGEYVVVVTFNFAAANPLPVVFNVSVN